MLRALIFDSLLSATDAALVGARVFLRMEDFLEHVRYAARSGPHWRDVHSVIPPEMRFDGASSPFSPTYPLIYGRETTAGITVAAREHDYMYGPARLPGSPTVGSHRLEDVTREQGDAMYAVALLDRGLRRVARRHWTAVRRCGAGPWRRNGAWFARRGIATYTDWLAAGCPRPG
jgi:hypothetical protein